MRDVDVRTTVVLPAAVAGNNDIVPIGDAPAAVVPPPPQNGRTGAEVGGATSNNGNNELMVSPSLCLIRTTFNLIAHYI